jgi:hypothetical protein
MDIPSQLVAPEILAPETTEDAELKYLLSHWEELTGGEARWRNTSSRSGVR